MPFSKALRVLSGFRGRSPYKEEKDKKEDEPENVVDGEENIQDGDNKDNEDKEIMDIVENVMKDDDEQIMRPEEIEEVRSDETTEEADYSAASTSRIVAGKDVHDTIDSEDKLPDVETSDDEIKDEMKKIQDNNAENASLKEDVEPEKPETEESSKADVAETPTKDTRRRSILKSLPKIPKIPHFKKPAIKKLHLRKKDVKPQQVEPVELLRDYRKIIDQQSKEDEIVYVERKEKFREMKKGMFSMEQMMEKTRIREGQEGRDVVPARYRDVASAYAVQRAYHNVSMIMQGFLSGLTAAEAIFAFNFANEDLLVHGYRYMSLPVHAVFLTCFTVGFVSGLDRLKSQRLSLDGFKQLFSDAGLIGVILWSIGLIATTVCLPFDEALSPIIKTPDVTPNMMLMWRICSAIRAFCAAAAWLLIALRAHTDDVCLELKNLVIKDLISVEGITEENLAVIKEKLFLAMNIAQ